MAHLAKHLHKDVKRASADRLFAHAILSQIRGRDDHAKIAKQCGFQGHWRVVAWCAPADWPAVATPGNRNLPHIIRFHDGGSLRMAGGRVCAWEVPAVHLKIAYAPALSSTWRQLLPRRATRNLLRCLQRLVRKLRQNIFCILNLYHPQGLRSSPSHSRFLSPGPGLPTQAPLRNGHSMITLQRAGDDLGLVRYLLQYGELDPQVKSRLPELCAVAQLQPTPWQETKVGLPSRVTLAKN